MDLKAGRDLFAAHAVLVFPAQELSADQHLTFACNFAVYSNSAYSCERPSAVVASVQRRLGRRDYLRE